MAKKKRETWGEDLRYSYRLHTGILVFWSDNIYAWLERAEVFHDAASATIRQYLKKPQYKASPVPAAGFLYRHSIELLLKAIIIVGKRAIGEPEEFLLSHDLYSLWRESQVAIRGIYFNGTDHQWERLVESWIEKVNGWDQTGLSFRYPSIKRADNKYDDPGNIKVHDVVFTCERLYRRLRMCFEGMWNEMHMGASGW